ncbi:hypothetical protein [uncultured Algibacter sp.]|uniref:hypothetical protein n=1 Tax=uncultured Algibacter sp. TaxID=298659 RepID=UPI00321729FF
MNYKKLVKVFLLTTVLAFVSCSDIDEIETLNEEALVEETDESSNLTSRFAASTFYTPPPANIARVTFNGTTSTDLNRLINQSKKNGAIIEIPRKTYTWGKVNLKSNVHLEIASGTIIKTSITRGAIFNIGASKQGARVENISITGKGGRFTIDLCDAKFTNKFVAAARVGRVDNFKLSNFNIKDRRSILNSILMIHVSGAAETRPGSNKGIVENITQTGSHTGYGLVQTYNCSNVLFKNLECEGGITLRLETDDRSMKQDVQNGTKEGGVKDISADNIRNSNGLCALMLSPHFVQNGKVTARRIISNSSGFAIRYDSGTVAIFDSSRAYALTSAGRTQFQNFVKAQFSGFTGNAFKGNAFQRNNGTQWAVNLSPEILNHGNRSQYIRNQIGSLKDGNFQNPTARNVTANYGTKAKLKQNQLKFIPCNQWSNITDPGTSFGLFRGFEYEGPSVGISLGNGVTITNGRKNGFPSGFDNNINLNTTQAKCNNAPNTIRRVNGTYPNCQ